MTDREIMQQALEALEGAEALLLSMGLTHLIVYGDAEKAITALQEALAEQPAQQEPVAEVVMAVKPPKASPAWIPFKTVYTSLEWLDSVPVGTKLYTSPPTLSLAQRKPLTDEQIEAIHQSTWIQSTATLNDFARAIEAAHGIKGDA